MSLNVSNFPKGLGSLLNLRERGESPHLLSQEVVPVLDVGGLYALNTIQRVSTFVAAIAQSGNNALTVPSNETWLVHSVAWVTTPSVLGAGVTIRAAPGVAHLPGSAMCPIVPFTTFGPGESPYWGATFESPLVLPAGAVIGLPVASLAGAGPVGNIAVALTILTF